MISNLPKELLWTDKKDIKDFKSDIIFNSVESALSFINVLKSKPLDGNTKLKIYNEAFYLSTRVVYEHDDKANPKAYMEKIMTDFGNKKLAEHVIRFMFFVLLLQSDRSKEVEMFIDKLQKQYLHSFILRIVNYGNSVLKPTENRGDSVLRPCPYSADKLRKVQLDWRNITQGFSKHTIVELLDLWDSEDEKGKVIRLIENAFMSPQPVTKGDDAVDKADEAFFIQQTNLYRVTNDEKGGRPKSESLDELFTEACTPAQMEKLIDIVGKHKGKEAVHALRVAALPEVGIIKQVPSYSSAEKSFPNIGASSNYYIQIKNEISEDEIKYYKRMLLL